MRNWASSLIKTQKWQNLLRVDYNINYPPSWSVYPSMLKYKKRHYFVKRVILSLILFFAYSVILCKTLCQFCLISEEESCLFWTFRGQWQEIKSIRSERLSTTFFKIWTTRFDILRPNEKTVTEFLLPTSDFCKLRTKIYCQAAYICDITF